MRWKDVPIALYYDFQHWKIEVSCSEKSCLGIVITTPTVAKVCVPDLPVIKTDREQLSILS